VKRRLAATIAVALLAVLIAMSGRGLPPGEVGIMTIRYDLSNSSSPCDPRVRALDWILTTVYGEDIVVIPGCGQP